MTFFTTGFVDDVWAFALTRRAPGVFLFFLRQGSREEGSREDRISGPI